jgi:hypothetical protein
VSDQNDSDANYNSLGERICTFDEWVAMIFDRESDTPLNRAFQTDTFYCINENAEHMVYYNRLFAEPAQIIGHYDDEQLGWGLRMSILKGGESDIYTLEDSSLPWAERKHAIELMYNVYEQIFELRCNPTVLSHTLITRRSEDERTALNDVCYMWWDIIGISGYKQPKIGDTAIGVMERVLVNLTNPACWESALHGLGHYQRFDPPRIRAAIDGFIASHPDLDPRLREYANAARYGAVL